VAYTDKQVIDVVRNAAECWWRELPREFRWADGTIKVPALKAIMRKAAGVACAVHLHEKDLAWYFEWMDRPEKERLLETALGIYRVGERTRETEEAMA
jgi:hypothetical protein